MKNQTFVFYEIHATKLFKGLLDELNLIAKALLDLNVILVEVTLSNLNEHFIELNLALAPPSLVLEHAVESSYDVRSQHFGLVLPSWPFTFHKHCSLEVNVLVEKFLEKFAIFRFELLYVLVRLKILHDWFNLVVAQSCISDKKLTSEFVEVYTVANVAKFVEPLNWGRLVNGCDLFLEGQIVPIRYEFVVIGQLIKLLDPPHLHKQSLFAS